MFMHLLQTEQQKPRHERLHNLETADVVRGRERMINQLRLSKVYDFSNLKLPNITEKARQVAQLLGCSGDLDVSKEGRLPGKHFSKSPPKVTLPINSWHSQSR